MNQALFIRNPENSVLGKNIIQYSIKLIHENGFESFTFKKLAASIGTTEAGIYRYFENKHKLLLYISSCYWQLIHLQINHILSLKIKSKKKLEGAIEIMVSAKGIDCNYSYLNVSLLHQIVISEGSKTYLTKHVDSDNRQRFFKPYKELCASFALIISENNPSYKYPKSLSSTIIEMAHYQNYFMNKLPSLTDFAHQSEKNILDFLNDLAFKSIGIAKNKI
jgi:hypothetical protein